MSVEAVLDAVAVKAAGVTGIKKAFGSGASIATVTPLPDQIADGPVCLVMYEGTEAVNNSHFEEVRHRFSCDVYVAAQETGAAFKTLLPFVSRFIAEFRTDRSLSGACTELLFEGADAPEGVDINGRPYSRISIRFVARENQIVTTSV